MNNKKTLGILIILSGLIIIIGIIYVLFLSQSTPVIKEAPVVKQPVIQEINKPIINQEIKRLLEEGIIFEPRPGKIRWLG